VIVEIHIGSYKILYKVHQRICVDHNPYGEVFEEGN
jgi:hypothetical protein